MTARTGFAAFPEVGRTQQNRNLLFFHQNQGAGNSANRVAGSIALDAASSFALDAI
ncbi:MAG: hypothetical protein PHW86_06400 [Candidatus Bipolaricaulis sp.]|nr:hypothetical protein [Candidatus Bipolaricaulis sp.]